MDLDYNISLRKVKEVEFFIKELPDNLIDSFNESDLKINFGYDFSIKPTDIFDLVIAIKYEYKTQDKLIQLLELKCLVSFTVLNIVDMVKNREEQSAIELPNDLFTSLLGISISSARGIIASRTQNYFINDFPLPLIDVTNMTN